MPRQTRNTTHNHVEQFSTKINFDGVQVKFDYFGEINFKAPITHCDIEPEAVEELHAQESFSPEEMQDTLLEVLETEETDPIDIKTLTVHYYLDRGIEEKEEDCSIALTDDEEDLLSAIEDIEDAASDMSAEISSLAETGSVCSEVESEKSEEDKFRESYMLPLPFVKKTKTNITAQKKAFSQSLHLTSSTGLVLPHSLLLKNQIGNNLSVKNNPASVPFTGSMMNLMMNMNAKTGAQSPMLFRANTSPVDFLKRTESSPQRRASPSPFARTSFSPMLPNNFIPHADD